MTLLSKNTTKFITFYKTYLKMDTPMGIENTFPFENIILAYLKNQEIDYEEEYIPPSESPSQKFVREFLEELIWKVERQTAWRERYREMKREHNQNLLFDILDFIPEFCLDDDMVKKMTFRENLIIASLDPINGSKKVGTLNATGGFVLDIQWAEGKLPKHYIPDCDTFEKELLETCKKIKECKCNGCAISYVDVANTEDKQSTREEFLTKQIQDLEKMLNEKIKSNHCKFLVHISSHFFCGFEAGSEVTSWVNRDFHTVEEKRKEYIFDQPDSVRQKTCYAGMQHKKYYVRNTCSRDNIDNRRYYGMMKMKNYISEGANYVLMRYMVISRYMGTLEMSCLYLNGDLCRNIYESKGPRVIQIGGKKVEAYKIHRTIIEQCGLVHRISTLYSTHGRIITQEWEGNPYILNINPKLNLDNKVFLPKYEYEELEYNWKNDLSLLSKYVDLKTNSELKFRTYMKDHPEVKEAISDYMQHVLLLKPSKIIEFTCEYFKKYLPLENYKGNTFAPDEDDVEFYMSL